MTRWHFQRRSDDALGGQPISIDASGIRRRWMVGKTREDIGEIQLAANGLPTPLADLF